ncbi:hypothetical protein B0H12DRAFT_1142910 [Mycena haematopus]|nr:hypothetical protein B0H12DRAFT_1142910 [Mycena haematopus]
MMRLCWAPLGYLVSYSYDDHDGLRSSSWATSSFSHPRPIRTPTGPPPKTYAPPPTCRDTSHLASYIRASLYPRIHGSLSIPLPPGLEALYTTLFAASTSFFNQPPARRTREDRQKVVRRTMGSATSRRKTAPHHPPRRLRHAFLSAPRDDRRGRVVHDIAESPRSTRSTPCPLRRERASSLLRLFRYNPPHETSRIDSWRRRARTWARSRSWCPRRGALD